MLTVWICNTPTHVVTYTHTHIRRREGVKNKLQHSTVELSLGREAEEHWHRSPQTHTLHAAPREELPLRWSQWSITCTYRMHLHLGLGSQAEERAALVFSHVPNLSFPLQASDFQLVWKAESWLFSHIAPSKVWSAPIHISQNIFGMWAVKCCLSPAAMGWAGLWRIVSLSSGTPSQGVLNWGSHVTTCTFLWAYT